MSNGNGPTDEEVAEAMRRYKETGDENEFALVVGALQPRLLAFVRKQTGDKSRAEDLVQETFINIHRARARYIDGAPVVPWAFAIARRLYIDLYRHERRGPTSDLSPDPEALARIAADCNERPDAQFEAKEMIERIAKALDALPKAQRVALVLVVDEGFSNDEAAEILGTTEMSLRLRLWRARRALEKALGIRIPDLRKSRQNEQPQQKKKDMKKKVEPESDGGLGETQ